MQLRFSQALRFNASWRGDQIAFRSGSESLTFRDVERRTARLAGYLSGELARGDRVCVLLNNGVIYPELYFGCARAAMLVVPLNPTFTAPELARIFAECDPGLIVTEQAHAATIAEALAIYGCAIPVLCRGAAPGSGQAIEGWKDFEMGLAETRPMEGEDVSAPDDAFVILFTSGTTGRPKGVLHSQANFMNGATSVVVSLGLVAPARALQVLTVAGINLVWVLAYFLAGFETVFVKHFDADEVVKMLDRERITHTVVAPIMLDLLTRCDEAGRPHDFSRVVMLGYGGSRTPSAVQRRALELFGPVLRQMYGQTEASGLLTSKGQSLHQNDIESVGYPLLGAEIRIIDAGGRDVTAHGGIGEIQARVPYLRLGYWKMDIGTSGDAWLRTGDTGLINEQGRLVVMGRTDDMIVTGGNNVFPREIEETLLRNPHIVDVAVLGVPDDVWGERVAAFVVGNGDMAPGELESEIDRYSRSALSSAKRPRMLFVVEALPRNVTGKVSKPALKEMALRKRPEKVRSV